MADELQKALHEFRAFIEPLLASKAKNTVAGGEQRLAGATVQVTRAEAVEAFLKRHATWRQYREELEKDVTGHHDFSFDQARWERVQAALE
jgi:hypothetical protein